MGWSATRKLDFPKPAENYAILGCMFAVSRRTRPTPTCKNTCEFNRSMQHHLIRNLLLKGGVYYAKETGEALRDAEGRDVEPLEGGTVVASDWARLWQEPCVRPIFVVIEAMPRTVTI
jgi:hypothetical protein